MFEKIAAAELNILSFIQKIQCGFLDFIMPPITFLGNTGSIWIIIALIFIFSKKYKRTGATLALTLGLCALINNLTLKPLIGRERPYTVDPSINLLINAPKDYSFPSGHTLASFACATVIWSFNKKAGTVAYILAFLIGFSRLYLQVHFLTDVIAGLFLGIAIGFLAIFIYNKFITRLIEKIQNK